MLTAQPLQNNMGYADWQALLQGPWAWDVSYTIFTSLTVESRRDSERELIAYYIDQLASAGGPRLNFEEAWDQYRRFVLYAYIAWAFTLGKGAMQPDMQPKQTVLRFGGA